MGTALLVLGLEKIIDIILSQCEFYLENKYTPEFRKPANKLIRGLQKLLDLAHSNLCGLIGIPSARKAMEFVILYDKASAVSTVSWVHFKEGSWALKSTVWKLRFNFSMKDIENMEACCQMDFIFEK